MPGRPRLAVTFCGNPNRDSRLLRIIDSLSTDWDILVAVPDQSGLASGNREGIVTVPVGRGGLRLTLPRYWKRTPLRLLSFAPDLVLASDVYTLPAASRLARRLHIPLVFDSRELYSAIAALHHRPLTQWVWNRIQRRALRVRQRDDIPMLLLTVNDVLAERLREEFPRHPVEVIPNYPRRDTVKQPNDARQGTDVEPNDLRRGSDIDAFALRELYRIPAEARLLVFQGGIQEGRGALCAVEAMPLLAPHHLLFLGDGPLYPELKARAFALGCEDRVHLHGAVPARDLAAWTRSADVGLCLIEDRGESYRYSLPNKFFEYVHAGLPVVASPLPLIADFVRTSHVGVVADDWSPTAIAHAVQAVNRGDEMFRTACLQWRERWCWESVEPTIRRVFMELHHSRVNTPC